MAWNLAVSLFNYGYLLVCVAQIKTTTLKDLYQINLSEGLAAGLLSGSFPIGGIFGAITSAIIIKRLSRRLFYKNSDRMS